MSTRSDSAKDLLLRWRATYPELREIRDDRCARYRQDGRWFMPLGGDWLSDTKLPGALFDARGVLFVPSRTDYEALLKAGHLRESHGRLHDTLSAPRGIASIPGYRGFPGRSDVPAPEGRRLRRRRRAGYLEDLGIE